MLFFFVCLVFCCFYIYIYIYIYIKTTKRNFTFIYIYIKVKWSSYRPGVAQRVGRGIALLFHDRGTRRGWVVSSMPLPHFTPGKDPVRILQEAGWAPGPFGREENLVPTGIRSLTVQPIVSRYTDWATRPTYYMCVCVCVCIYIYTVVTRSALWSREAFQNTFVLSATLPECM